MAPFWSSLGVCTSPMLVHLAGVELTPEGSVWLQKNLAPAQTVWLKLISREDDILHCLVSQSKVRHLITEKNCGKYQGKDNSLFVLNVRLIGVYIPWSHFLVSPQSVQQGSMWSYCMNEEVLRLGLARTAPVVGVLPDSRLYWRLHKRLHRAEVKAERKGLGLWKQDSLWERASKAVRENALFTLMRRIFKRTWLIVPRQNCLWTLKYSKYDNRFYLYCIPVIANWCTDTPKRS